MTIASTKTCEGSKCIHKAVNHNLKNDVGKVAKGCRNCSWCQHIERASKRTRLHRRDTL